MTKTAEQRAHILAVADFIENEPESFDMRNWDRPAETPCGSVMCIGGTSDLIAGEGWSLGDDAYVIALRFGIGDEEATGLCFESGPEVALNMPAHLRAKGMADALRQIAEDVRVPVALMDVGSRYV